MSDPLPARAPAPVAVNADASAKAPVAVVKTTISVKPAAPVKTAATTPAPARASSPQPAQIAVTTQVPVTAQIPAQAPAPPRRDARATVFAALDRLMAKAEAMAVTEPLPAPARVAVMPAVEARVAPSPVAAKAEARAPTVTAALKTPADDNRLFEVRAAGSGHALFACRTIAAGKPLFGEDDWADETEKRSFTTLTEAQLVDLAPAMREAFLRFAYNVTPEQIRGTFRPEGVRHPVNFINHSCEPNAGYDGADHIVALRRIAPGEEINMDYGTYSFSFDHEFTCGCGAWACRGKVTREDWPELVRAGLRLPAFMRAQANKALWG